jgi:hypothetical protein
MFNSYQALSVVALFNDVFPCYLIHMFETKRFGPAEHPLSLCVGKFDLTYRIKSDFSIPPLFAFLALDYSYHRRHTESFGNLPVLIQFHNRYERPGLVVFDLLDLFVTFISILS